MWENMQRVSTKGRQHIKKEYVVKNLCMHQQMTDTVQVLSLAPFLHSSQANTFFSRKIGTYKKNKQNDMKALKLGQSSVIRGKNAHFVVML